MMPAKPNTRSPFLPFVFSLFVAPACTGGHEEAHWGYSGTTGPEFWSQLSPENEKCSAGAEQSPIDISATYTSGSLGRLVLDYKQGGAKVVNNGHTLQVNFDAGSTLTVADKKYNLLQFHAHSPSEHTINGISYPMEIHFVHKSDDGKLAVIGVLLSAGADNTFVSKWLDPAPKTVGEVVLSNKLNGMDVMPSDPTYFTYPGSLTTPPCSEGVKWLVMKQTGSVSWGQVDRFIGVSGMNSRPVQPLKGRKVESFIAP